MVRFSLSALAVIASATLIGAVPVGPRQDPTLPDPPVKETGVLPNLQRPPWGSNGPDGELVPPPAPQPQPAAAPDTAPAAEPAHEDGTEADASDANPFSAGSDTGDKDIAETYVEALTSP